MTIPGRTTKRSLSETVGGVGTGKMDPIPTQSMAGRDWIDTGTQAYRIATLQTNRPPARRIRVCLSLPCRSPRHPNYAANVLCGRFWAVRKILGQFMSLSMEVYGTISPAYGTLPAIPLALPEGCFPFPLIILLFSILPHRLRSTRLISFSLSQVRV